MRGCWNTLLGGYMAAEAGHNVLQEPTGHTAAIAATERGDGEGEKPQQREVTLECCCNYLASNLPIKAILVTEGDIDEGSMCGCRSMTPLHNRHWAQRYSRMTYDVR